MNSLINGINFEITAFRGIKSARVRGISEDGAVRLSVPYTFSESDIFEFVKYELEEIRKLLKAKNNSLEGRSCWIWGIKHTIKVNFGGRRNSVSAKDGFIILSLKPETSVKQQVLLLDAFLRNELKKGVNAVFSECEGLVGVTASEWHIKKMKTRWGTCNTQNKRIWLSTLLVSRPPECLRYIIVHELVHIIERSHNGIFWTNVARCIPDWKRIKDSMKRPLE